MTESLSNSLLALVLDEIACLTYSDINWHLKKVTHDSALELIELIFEALDLEVTKDSHEGMLDKISFGRSK